MDASNLALISVIVYLLTEWLKKVPWFPVFEKQKARIRTLVYVLGFIGAGVTAYFNGTWTDWISTQDVQVALQALVVLAVTWLGHKGRNAVENLWKFGRIVR